MKKNTRSKARQPSEKICFQSGAKGLTSQEGLENIRHISCVNCAHGSCGIGLDRVHLAIHQAQHALLHQFADVLARKPTLPRPLGLAY